MPGTSNKEKIIAFLEKYPLIPLIVIYALHTAFTLNTRSLWFSDEVRYANVYEHLIHFKKWLVLYLNGTPYPDKPPLYFWFLLLLSKLTNLKDIPLFFLGTAISGLFYLLATYFLGKITLKDKKKAFIGCALLLTNFYFLGLIHYFRMDLLFATFILLAHICIFLYLEKEKTFLLYLAFFLSALATLTKGPLGFALPFLTLVISAFWFKKRHLLLTKHTLLALGMLLGLAGLWLLGAYLVEGKDFIHNILYDQIYRRATNTWHHPQPFYHYLLVFPLVSLPWSLLFLFPHKLNLNALEQGEKFLLIFFLAGFSLLSLISIKIAVYLLPLFAPFFLFCSRFILVKDYSFSKVIGCLFLGLALILPWLNYFPLLNITISGLPYLSALFLLLSLILLKKNFSRYALTLFLLFSLPLPFLFTAKVVAPSLDPLMSPKKQALIIQKYIQQGYTPIAYKIYSGIYTYYAGKNIKETKEIKEILTQTKENPKTLLIIPEKYYKKHLKELENFKIVHRQKIVEKNYLLLIPKEQKS